MFIVRLRSLRSAENLELFVEALTNLSNFFAVAVPFVLVFKHFETSHAYIAAIAKTNERLSLFNDIVWEGAKSVLLEMESQNALNAYQALGAAFSRFWIHLDKNHKHVDT